MGEFFTRAALVTFGGAYAVLPYVYQGGVETYGWLTGEIVRRVTGMSLGAYLAAEIAARVSRYAPRCRHAQGLFTELEAS